MHKIEFHGRRVGKTHKAITALEQQSFRLIKTINQALTLLRSAREDGGLTKVQSECLDKLIAQNEAIMSGLDQEVFGLTKADRLILANYLDKTYACFSFFLEGQLIDADEAASFIECLRAEA